MLDTRKAPAHLIACAIVYHSGLPVVKSTSDVQTEIGLSVGPVNTVGAPLNKLVDMIISHRHTTLSFFLRLAPQRCFAMALSILNIMSYNPEKLVCHSCGRVGYTTENCVGKQPRCGACKYCKVKGHTSTSCPALKSKTGGRREFKASVCGDEAAEAPATIFSQSTANLRTAKGMFTKS